MIPQTLTNFNLFVDGKGFAGLATQVTLPKLKVKADTHRAGGMDVGVKLDLGMEEMEGSFTLSGISADALKFFGLADQTAFAGVFRGAFRDQKGQVVAAIVTFRGALHEVDMGDWKPGEKSENKFTVDLAYYKLEIDGAAMYEIDAVGMKRVINGTDQLEAVRTAIGM